MRISDWSSDVCSSDLFGDQPVDEIEIGIVDAIRRHDVDRVAQRPQQHAAIEEEAQQRRPKRGEIVAMRLREFERGDRKSVVSGKSVSVRVVLGGRRILKQKTKARDRTRIT